MYDTPNGLRRRIAQAWFAATFQALCLVGIIADLLWGDGSTVATLILVIVVLLFLSRTGVRIRGYQQRLHEIE